MCIRDRTTTDISTFCETFIVWFWFLRFHVGQFFFPHWRADDHAWTRALQHHKAFCENFLFFSSCFAVSWVTVNEFWSKPTQFSNFSKKKFFQKSKFLVISKIIKFGKFLIFGRGSQSTIFGRFHYSACFLTKNHPICNIPKIIFGQKSTPFNGYKSWIFG